MAFNVGVTTNPFTDFGPGQTGDSNIDRRWQDQVDLDSDLRKYYEKKEFHDIQRRYEREDQVWKRGYDAQVQFANNSLAWQYKQARDAGLDPSVVHGAPGFRPVASVTGGAGGGPRMGAPPKMPDQNVTRAARNRGLMSMAQMSIMGKAEKNKVDAETEMIRAQRDVAKETVRKSQETPLTHQVFYNPTRNRYIMAPTREFAAAMMVRPFTSMGHDMREMGVRETKRTGEGDDGPRIRVDKMPKRRWRNLNVPLVIRAR